MRVIPSAGTSRIVAGLKRSFMMLDEEESSASMETIEESEDADMEEYADDDADDSEADKEFEMNYFVPDDPNDTDFIVDDDQPDVSDSSEAEDGDPEESPLEISANPPIWTNKGTITWEEVKNTDYVFDTIGSKISAWPYYYVLRCESAPGQNIHHFTKNPWRSGPDHIVQHLKQSSKCHDEQLSRELVGGRQSGIQKALGYEGMGPALPWRTTEANPMSFTSHHALRYSHPRG